MRRIYYDPVTLTALPNFQDYTVEPYDLNSFMVQKLGEEGVNIVDVKEFNEIGSCTCQDYAFRKDPNNLKGKATDNTCKHIRMVKCLIRIQNTITPITRKK